MSEEICIDPILADAPVITHVTVQKTDEKDGEIRISWRSPFEISETQFPPPYYYKVWRASGFAGAKPWTEVHTGTLLDTTEVDTGINTLDRKIENVNVRIYSPLTKDAIPKTAMIFIHGGGYVFGDLNSYDPFLVNFVKELNMIIISIE